MGIIPYDLLFTVSEYPKAEMKIDASSFFSSGGGPVPNVMVGLARLGYNSALIASVGNDPFGQIMLKELKDDKVNTDYMIIKKDPTALATGWIEQGSGRRTMVLSRQIEVKPSDLKLNNLPRTKLIHLDGRDMPATMKLARWAKRSGIMVSFDIGSVRNDVSAVFPFVDHLVLADQYAFDFTNTKNVKKAIERLKKYCPGCVVVTEGIKGSIGLDKDRSDFVFQKAYKVKNIDTTGAGDCYHSGYLFGWLRKADLAERMKLGAAAAALKCTHPGARSGIPTKKELFAFLKRNPKTY